MEEHYLEDLLKRKEYEFILDLTCVHVEPNEKDHYYSHQNFYDTMIDNDQTNR